MKKLIFLIVFYFLSSLNLYSFDANISVTKEEIWLKDNTKLRIQINHDNTKNIEIKEIKWIDNFIILNKTSWTSSSSNIVIVDWKTTSQSKTIDFIDLTLSPKKSWNFNIWPVIVETSEEKKETNIISINVSESYKQKHENNDFKKDIKDDYLILIILLFSLIFSLGLAYYFKKELFNNFFEKYKNKLIKNDQKIEEKVQEVKSEIFLDFPSFDDQDFAKKINYIFINKIKSKYYIENIEKKSNEEIHALIPDDLYDKEIIWKIIFILNRLKYSNEDIEKNEIIDLLKKI